MNSLSNNEVRFTRWFFAACGVVLGILLASSVHGQRRTVNESEIDDLVKAATDARQSLAYRLTHTAYSARPSETEETRVSVSLFEWVAPDQWRSTIEYRPSSTSDLVRRETRRIGYKQFALQPSGDWTVTTISSSPGSLSGFTKPRYRLKMESLVCQYVGTEVMGGKTVDMYRKVGNYKSEVPSGGFVLSRMTKTFWFDKKGLLIKEDHLFDNAANSTPRSHYVWEYEYDPTIRIEEPVMPKGTARR
jgi:hypothetical protein